MVVKDKIAREDIQPPFVKAAADVKKELVAIGCELHSDCAEELISAGSDSCDIWGFNIYTDGTLTLYPYLMFVRRRTTVQWILRVRRFAIR